MSPVYINGVEQGAAGYTDAEALAAAVQAGAITDGVTLAPTHDAVYDVKVTADAALPKQMVENDPLLLDAAISGDGYYSGICEAGIAGAALVFGNLCYLAAVDSRWELADSNFAAGTANAKHGICVLAAAGNGSATRILLYGKVNAASLYPALTIGEKVFVGETPGNIQVAAPTADTDVIRVIGFANTADELFFCPEAATMDIVDDTIGGNNSAIYKAASANVVYDHTTNTTTAHGAVSAATASKIVVRDASARAAFAAPAAAGDALIKGTALTITEMAALTTGKIWQGVANRPSEVNMPAAGVALPVQAIKKTVNYNDSSPVTVVTLPAGSLVISAAVNIQTAFVGTTPTLIIGDAGDTDGYFASAHIDPTNTGWKPTVITYYGAYLYGSTEKKLFKYWTAQTTILATIGGTSLSAGVADVYIIYISLS